MTGSAPSPAPGDPPLSGDRPAPVRAAVRLMYGGAALSVLLGILRLLDPDPFRDAVGDQPSADGLRGMSSDGQLAGYVVFAFAVAGVWLWVARACRRGSARGRAAAFVFGTGYIAVTIVALFQVGMNAGTVVSVVMMAVAAAVMWLLSRADSRRYYAGGAGMRRLE